MPFSEGSVVRRDGSQSCPTLLFCSRDFDSDSHTDRLSLPSRGLKPPHFNRSPRQLVAQKRWGRRKGPFNGGVSAGVNNRHVFPAAHGKLLSFLGRSRHAEFH